MRPDRFITFLEAFGKVHGTDMTSRAETLYRELFEGAQPAPLTVPDSISQGPALYDYRGLMKTVATANGTSAPDVVGNYKYGPAMAGPTRDIAEETRKSKWSVPDYAKPEIIQKKITAQLMKKAKENLPCPVEDNVFVTQMPMRSGYSISSTAGIGYKNGVTTVTDGGGSESQS